MYGLRVSFFPYRHRTALFGFPPSLALRPQHEHQELLGSLAIEPVPFSWRKPVECIKGHLSSTTHPGWSACTAWRDGTRRKFRTAAFFLSSVHLQRGQGPPAARVRGNTECAAPRVYSGLFLVVTTQHLHEMESCGWYGLVGLGVGMRPSRGLGARGEATHVSCGLSIHHEQLRIVQKSSGLLAAFGLGKVLPFNTWVRGVSVTSALIPQQGSHSPALPQPQFARGSRLAIAGAGIGTVAGAVWVLPTRLAVSHLRSELVVVGRRRRCCWRLVALGPSRQ